ncbi:hypothetical protein [Amycolatopsis sp. NPDC058986]|uniref:hypothetical protein n=1 Tax=unclassified Amycolatopsis TaxID=2618356 RepID=UPI00366F46F7
MPALASSLLTLHSGHSGGGHGLDALLGSLARGFVASLGWQAGKTFGQFLGAWLVVLVLVAVAVWLLRALRKKRR